MEFSLMFLMNLDKRTKLPVIGNYRVKIAPIKTTVTEVKLLKNYRNQQWNLLCFLYNLTFWLLLPMQIALKTKTLEIRPKLSTFITNHQHPHEQNLQHFTASNLLINNYKHSQTYSQLPIKIHLNLTCANPSPHCPPHTRTKIISPSPPNLQMGLKAPQFHPLSIHIQSLGSQTMRFSSVWHCPPSARRNA